jgi:hypothetical protein
VRAPPTSMPLYRSTALPLTSAQVRSSLLAAVIAVQEYARSCGVCIVVEDAGAGLRKSVPPGDEVRLSYLPAPKT